MTNNHVVDNAVEVTVVFSNGFWPMPTSSPPIPRPTWRCSRSRRPRAWSGVR
ncbi:MAG: hypothetical protein R2838_15765 [Caldilineaceae bacterium]